MVHLPLVRFWSLANRLAFPRTWWGCKQGSAESRVEKREATRRALGPRRLFPAKEMQKEASSFRVSDTETAKSEVLGRRLHFFSTRKPLSVRCCNCLISTIKQHLGIKCGNLYSLLGICGLYGTSSVSTEATEN